MEVRGDYLLYMCDSQGKRWLPISLYVDQGGDYLWSSYDDVEDNTYITYQNLFGDEYLYHLIMNMEANTYIPLIMNMETHTLTNMYD